MRRVTPFQALLVFLLGYALLQGLAYVWLDRGNRAVRTHDLGKFNRAIEGELDGQVVILGSSRAFVHYSPSVMEPILGAPVYNLGLDAADTVEQNALHLLVSEFNRPRLIVLNLDSAGLNPGIMTFHQATVAPFFFRHDGVRQIMLERNPYDWKYWLSPASVFQLSCGVAHLLGHAVADRSDRGAALQDRMWDGSFDQWKRENPNGHDYSPDPARWAALEAIARRAAGPGQPPMVWMVSPELTEWRKMDRQRDATMSRMKTLAESNGIVWMDFTGPDCALCQDRVHFYNSQHLNAKAAKLFSAQAAEALKPLLQPQ